MTPLLISAIVVGPIIFLALLWWSPRPSNGGSNTSGVESGLRATHRSVRSSRILGISAALAGLALIGNIYISSKYVGVDIALRQSVLGAIFGSLFAYWLCSILMSGAKGAVEQGGLMSRFAVMWIVMIALLTVGIADERTIFRFAKLGANLKLPGGAELAIGHEAARSRDTSLAVIVPPAKGTRTAVSPDASSGLEMFSGLAEAARRDGLYYSLSKDLLSGASPDPAVLVNVENFKDALDYMDLYAGKLGKCLEFFVERNEDDYMAGATLEPLGGALRDLVLSADSGGALSTSRFDEGLKDFTANATKALSAISKKECVEWSHLAGSDDARAAFVKYLKVDGPFHRPYVWSAAAAILVYNHRYTPSIALLHRWIVGARDSSSGSDEALRNVFMLRIRSQIAAYIEEWINYRPLAKTQSVLDYHRDNLDEAITLLEDMLKKPSPLSEQKSAGFAFYTSGNDRCDQFNKARDWLDDVKKWVNPETIKEGSNHQQYKDYLSPARIEMALFATLLSLKRTWIDSVLAEDSIGKTSNFDVKLVRAFQVAEELRDFDTQCLRLVRMNNTSNGKAYADLVRAQNLEAFARAARFVALTVSDVHKREVLLTEAQREAELGIKLIAVQAEKDRDERNKSASGLGSFSESISGSEAMQTDEGLRSIAATIIEDLSR